MKLTCWRRICALRVRFMNDGTSFTSSRAASINEFVRPGTILIQPRGRTTFPARVRVPQRDPVMAEGSMTGGMTGDARCLRMLCKRQRGDEQSAAMVVRRRNCSATRRSCTEARCVQEDRRWKAAAVKRAGHRSTAQARPASIGRPITRTGIAPTVRQVSVRVRRRYTCRAYR